MDVVDAAIARIAAAHMGLVPRSLALTAGVSAGALKHRLTIGRLRPVHRGVYTTTYGDLTETQRFLAATLAAGGVLSHGSAAALWRILAAPPGPPDVLYAGKRRGPVGVRLHRTQTLPPTDVTSHRGVPVTTLLRTLLDLAATGPPARLELAFNEARALRLVTPEQLAATTGRGSAALRKLLEDAPGFTRSQGERRLRALVRAAQLPPPRTNVVLHGHEIDAYWPVQKLALEVDGYAAHSTRTAFERERSGGEAAGRDRRRRDQELTARGIRVTRITWRQLTHEPEAVGARLAAGLAAT